MKPFDLLCVVRERTDEAMESIKEVANTLAEIITSGIDEIEHMLRDTEMIEKHLLDIPCPTCGMTGVLKPHSKYPRKDFCRVCGYKLVSGSLPPNLKDQYPRAVSGEGNETDTDDPSSSSSSSSSDALSGFTITWKDSKPMKARTLKSGKSDSSGKSDQTGDSSSKDENHLQINVAYCESCKHYHAIIPAQLPAYGRFTLLAILLILQRHYFSNLAVKEVCEEFDITERTFYKLRKRFYIYYDIWAKSVDRIITARQSGYRDCRYTESRMALANRFCHAIDEVRDFPHITNDFFNRFHLSFMGPIEWAEAGNNPYAVPITDPDAGPDHNSTTGCNKIP